MRSRIKLMARCTSCGKTMELTESQISESRVMGCGFSACCKAVATIERVITLVARRQS